MIAVYRDYSTVPMANSPDMDDAIRFAKSEIAASDDSPVFFLRGDDQLMIVAPKSMVSAIAGILDGSREYLGAR